MKALLALFVGVLLVWVGVSGQLGSLLAALIAPQYMVQGTPSTGNAGGTNTVTPNPNIGNIVPKTGVLTPIEIATLAVSAGLTNNLVTAIAIALAESGGNSQAISRTGDYGIWQIHWASHQNLGYSQQQLLIPATNAAAMVTISQNGTNWNPWTTYTTGAYKAYLGQAQNAANSVFAGI